MRAVSVVLMLLVLIAGCAGKSDQPINTDDQAAAGETVTGETTDAAVESTATSYETLFTPVGNLYLQDGSTVEITDIKRLGNFLIYINGELNGRTPTVMSITRQDDLWNWKVLIFEEDGSLIIRTRANKQLRFTDAHVYLGSADHQEYTFLRRNSINLELEEVSVDKSKVKAIAFNKPEDVE